MWGLIRKDLWWYLGYLILVTTACGWLLHEDGMDRGWITMVGGCAFLLALGPSAVVEHLDRGGYAFLSLLPLQNKRIVAAKLLPPAILQLAFLGAAVTAVMVTTGNDVFRTLGITHLAAAWMAGLTTVGVMYAAIFRFGVTSALKVILLGLPTLGLILPGIALVGFREQLHRIDTTQLARAIGWGPAVFLAAAGIVVYFGLAWLAYRVKAAYPSSSD